MPRTTNTAMMAPAKTSGGYVGTPAAKPPSSSGLISAGKSGSVAAAATMPSTATANTFT